MKKYIGLIPLFSLLLLMSCGENEETEEFKGKVARSYEESKEWWPDPVKAPKNAPNIILFLLDDTGFAHLGRYGGLIKTPNLDRLADNGLRFNNFHTTALCSPSRASIMAGRNPHSIGLGSHSLTAMGFPGYNAMIPPSAQSVAKILQKNGYTNYALGKWDHTPLYEVSQIGPFEHWPTNEGFDHYYGFMAADAHQFVPVMWSEHTPLEPNKARDKNYHLDEDLANKTIEYITGHKSIDPDKPFMVFWATGAMHSPHHAPDSYIEKYKGQFDMGWDKARETILENQKKLGIIPQETILTDRVDDIPAWDSLSEDEKRLYAKQMEVFAAQLEHTDYQIGRILDTLERIGELDNTLIIVTSDNGASGEGGLAGTFNETYVLNGLQTPLEANMEHLDTWGTIDTYPHYHAGWAMAGNTPFKYFKQAVHRGGIQDPLIIHWPNEIKEKGEIRNQYHHITDIAPTILQATGIPFMKSIDGVKQKPFDGISMDYTFDNAEAKSKKDIQYYEMFGNRAIYANGWKAVSLHGNRMPWELNATFSFDQDQWELYHVENDFSESKDLSKEHPEKLKELVELFDEQAWKYNVYPLYDDMIMRVARQQDRLFGDRTQFTYYAPGAIRIAEKASAPVKNRSHNIKTSIQYTGNEEGVIVACGGFTGGYALFVKDGKVFFDYNFYNGVYYTIESPPLHKGKSDILFKFEKTGDYKGIGKLFINGRKVGEVEMPEMHISTFSLSETFDVGKDTGTPVSNKYEGDFPFTKGKLDKVVIEIEKD